MPSNAAAPGVDVPEVPSMLDLVRLSPRRLFPPGGVELYRQIALLTDMSPRHEVLSVACGKGVSLGYFVTEHGVIASGVDVDPGMVELAEKWSRDEGLQGRLQSQTGRSDSLPYRDEIFDVAIGEIGLSNHCEPADAISELVRVTKPGGFVILVQLVWKAPVDPERRRILASHLGARPLMVVEWKRLLREAGVEDLHTENWSDDQTSFRSTVVKPFPDFAELFSLPERMGILRRAWQRWGIRGVSTVLARETEVHKLLTNERILGLDLMWGRKPGGVPPRGETSGRDVRPEDATDGDAEEGRARHPGRSRVPASVAAARERDQEDPNGNGSETEGLPLFGRTDEADSSGE